MNTFHITEDLKVSKIMYNLGLYGCYSTVGGKGLNKIIQKQIGNSNSFRLHISVVLVKKGFLKTLMFELTRKGEKRFSS